MRLIYLQVNDRRRWSGAWRAAITAVAVNVLINNLNVLVCIVSRRLYSNSMRYIVSSRYKLDLLSIRSSLSSLFLVHMGVRGYYIVRNKRYLGNIVETGRNKDDTALPY